VTLVAVALEEADRMTEIAQYDDKKTKRTKAQIEKDMDATRERLVGTVAELEERVKPANLLAGPRAKIEGFYKKEDGSVRPESIALTAAAVVGTIIALRITSRSVRWVFGAPRQPARKPPVVYVTVPDSAVPAA
jgi:Protein of unknown function (DUF3618)